VAQTTQIKNADGSISTITVDYKWQAAPTTEVARPLFGTDRKPIDTTIYDGPTGYVRMFAGSGLPDLSAVPASWQAHPSMGTLQSDAVINAYFSKWLRGGRITVKHEVNGGNKGTIAQFKADVRHLVALRNAHPNGHLWTVTEIYSYYAEVNKATGKSVDWSTISDPTIPDEEKADEGSMDCYVPLTATSPPDAVAFWQPVINARDAIQQAAGKAVPWIISEFGFPCTGDGSYSPFLLDSRDMAVEQGWGAMAEWDNAATSPLHVLKGDELTVWTTICEVQ